MCEEVKANSIKNFFQERRSDFQKWLTNKDNEIREMIGEEKKRYNTGCQAMRHREFDKLSLMLWMCDRFSVFIGIMEDCKLSSSNAKADLQCIKTLFNKITLILEKIESEKAIESRMLSLTAQIQMMKPILVHLHNQLPLHSSTAHKERRDFIKEIIALMESVNEYLMEVKPLVLSHFWKSTGEIYKEVPPETPSKTSSFRNQKG